MSNAYGIRIETYLHQAHIPLDQINDVSNYQFKVSMYSCYSPTFIHLAIYGETEETDVNKIYGDALKIAALGGIKDSDGFKVIIEEICD